MFRPLFAPHSKIIYKNDHPPPHCFTHCLWDFAVCSLSIEEKQSRARNFLTVQNDRAKKIEDELLLATQHILPTSNDSKTITELAELCRLTQEATRQKLDLLRSRLEEVGYVVTSPAEAHSTSNSATRSNRNRRQLDGRTVVSSSSSNFHRSRFSPQKSKLSSSPSLSWPMLMESETSFGRPLESVLEADVETDGTITPGSQLMSTPSSRNFGSVRTSSGGGGGGSSGSMFNHNFRRKSSYGTILTPTTPPTLENLSLTATTNHFLQNMSDTRSHRTHFVEDQEEEVHDTFLRRPSESPGTYRYRGSDLGQRRPLSFEFRDEDDMITLDTQSTMTKNTSSPAVTRFGVGTPSVEERSQFLARMEGMLERVDESILEESSPSTTRRTTEQLSRPSDELKAFLRPTHWPDSASVRSEHSHLTEESNQSSGSRSSYRSMGSKKGVIGAIRTSKTFYEEHSQESYGDNHDDDDDSTNVVATQVAESPSPHHRGNGNQGAHLVSFENRKKSTGSAAIESKTHPLNLFKRPTHILVDNAVSSPTHTNITMDATMMMNETYNMSHFVVDENDLDQHEPGIEIMFEKDDVSDDDRDNLSSVTPILDRYRLDPDDNSIGVKVVPNERGPGHSAGRHRQTTPRHDAILRQQRQYQLERKSPAAPTVYQAKTPKQASLTRATTTPPTASSFRSPSTQNSATVTAHSNKIYRKTPFPKRKPTNEDEPPSIHSLDENDHPNISTAGAASSPAHMKSSSTLMQISVPPLRPRSFESSVGKQATTSFTNLSLGEARPIMVEIDKSVVEARRRMIQDESDTIDHIDRTIERIELELAAGSNHQSSNSQHSGNESDVLDLLSGRVDPVGKSLNEALAPKEKRSYQFSWIKRITLAEFETAPRIVQTQITIAEANDALDAIGEHFYESMTQNKSLEFLDKEGHDILKHLVGSSVQKSKSLLISLCHWRRLVMRRDASRGLVFAVNMEKEARTFRC